MTRTLRTVFLELQGLRFDEVSDAVSGEPSGWLPDPGRWDGHGHEAWLVTLEAGRARRTVRCRVGSPWRFGDELWRSLRWEPVPEAGDPLPVERFLPTFAGSIGVRAGAGGAELVLEGRYDVPAGVVGAAADAALLHRVAESTAAAFLAAVAARVADDAAVTPAAAAPVPGGPRDTPPPRPGGRPGAS